MVAEETGRHQTASKKIMAVKAITLLNNFDRLLLQFMLLSTFGSKECVADTNVKHFVAVFYICGAFDGTRHV